MLNIIINNTFIGNICYSPLEQFQIIPLVGIRLCAYLDISITQAVVIAAIVVGSTVIFFIAITFKFVPTYWQIFAETLYKVTASVVFGNVKDERAEKFFPVVCTVFLVIISLNVIGLVPYSFTITGHLITTLAIGVGVFFAINAICVEKYKIQFWALFLPPGTTFLLSLLLVPIEMVSYVFKPFSLAIRLFANMMAGHILLKVIAGFAYTLMASDGFLFLGHYVPLIIVTILFVLELAVALIQAYVFAVLISIYINDALSLH